MKLLFDRLRAQVRGTPLEDRLKDAVVFYNDDALQQAIDGNIELEELPSLAPPYATFFIECKFPLFDEVRDMQVVAMPRMGALITALEYPEGQSPRLRVERNQQFRWAYEILLFLENLNTFTIETVGAGRVLLDGDGQALRFTLNAAPALGYCYFTFDADYYTRLTTDVPRENPSDHNMLPQMMIDAALYTVGMLHCRNIGTNLVAPSRAEGHKFEKRHGVPMSSYRILKVTGKGRDAGTTIGAPGTGAKKALHWARGHFRNYSEDAPLFGFYVGTVYVHPHMRGSAKRGVTTKDYQVEVTPETIREAVNQHDA